jgi:hypothetical protein
MPYPEIEILWTIKSMTYAKKVGNQLSSKEGENEAFWLL